MSQCKMCVNPNGRLPCVPAKRSCDEADVVSAVLRVAAGQRVISPTIQAVLVDGYVRRRSSCPRASDGRPGQNPAAPSGAPTPVSGSATAATSVTVRRQAAGPQRIARDGADERLACARGAASAAGGGVAAWLVATGRAASSTKPSGTPRGGDVQEWR